MKKLLKTKKKSDQNIKIYYPNGKIKEEIRDGNRIRKNEIKK